MAITANPQLRSEQKDGTARRVFCGCGAPVLVVSGELGVVVLEMLELVPRFSCPECSGGWVLDDRRARSKVRCARCEGRGWLGDVIAGDGLVTLDGFARWAWFDGELGPGCAVHRLHAEACSVMTAAVADCVESSVPPGVQLRDRRAA